MKNYVKCHMCGSDSYDVIINTLKPDSDFKYFYKITDHTVAADVCIVTCRRCNLSYLNPQPKPEIILENYISMIDEKYIVEEQGRRASARYILKYLNKVKPDKGRLLDIGCAAGFFLDEAKKDGWDVYGVEASQWAVNYAQQHLGLSNVSQGTPDALKLKINSFDAVVMTDVIEHLIEPKKNLEDIRLLLKSNGIICCNTPDAGSLASRILGARWWGIKQSHLFYFNKNTLERIFNSAGFSVIKVRFHTRTFSLGYWLENLAVYKPEFKFFDNLIKKYPRVAAFRISVNLGDQIEIFARPASKKSCDSNNLFNNS